MVNPIRKLTERLLDCRVISAALVIAAEQAYQSEIDHTLLTNPLLKTNDKYPNRELWIADKVTEWTDEAEEWLKSGTK